MLHKYHQAWWRRCLVSLATLYDESAENDVRSQLWKN